MDAMSNNFLPLEQRTQAADAALAYANSLVRSAVAGYRHERLNTESNRADDSLLLRAARDEFISAFMAEKDALQALNGATNRLAVSQITGKIT